MRLSGRNSLSYGPGFLAWQNLKSLKENAHILHDLYEMEKYNKIMPYLYEPTGTLYNSNNDEDESSSRLNNTEWCKCELCTVTESQVESYCCAESSVIAEVKRGLKCITLHESFYDVILDLHTLQVSRYQMLLHAEDAVTKKVAKIRSEYPNDSENYEGFQCAVGHEPNYFD
ncbi:hypothetical protein FQR65_LT13777 [Abscondita terminalis]|nr:hypothetical protein FQR65_LT13777 [Abscondita terminalis]